MKGLTRGAPDELEAELESIAAALVPRGYELSAGFWGSLGTWHRHWRSHRYPATVARKAAGNSTAAKFNPVLIKRARRSRRFITTTIERKSENE
jgi:hypothetical protein